MERQGPRTAVEPRVFHFQDTPSTLRGDEGGDESRQPHSGQSGECTASVRMIRSGTRTRCALRSMRLRSDPARSWRTIRSSRRGKCIDGARSLACCSTAGSGFRHLPRVSTLHAGPVIIITTPEAIDRNRARATDLERAGAALEPIADGSIAALPPACRPPGDIGLLEGGVALHVRR